LDKKGFEGTMGPPSVTQENVFFDEIFMLVFTILNLFCFIKHCTNILYYQNIVWDIHYFIKHNSNFTLIKHCTKILYYQNIVWDIHYYIKHNSNSTLIKQCINILYYQNIV